MGTIEELIPYIEFIDYTPINPSDMNKRQFHCKDDPIKVIKWCRRNFGNRGDGWDYEGIGNKVVISVWSSKLLVMYELWQN
jgi:hypothetical protein